LRDDLINVRALAKKAEVVIDGEERPNIQEGLKLLINTGLYRALGDVYEI
jgi:hypothetical protein